ncbi:hypothetical protein NDU88_004244 [Pleurodeles waltl]|uniref:Uncharacterized protein n=1 Tax=Pleurodeles waltl TaxID=8319 RepID=A0AAV7UF48_PLEWA|nr:hypothetical protein NDU88_004244 [Pleurodeles waltl]
MLYERVGSSAHGESRALLFWKTSHPSTVAWRECYLSACATVRAPLHSLAPRVPYTALHHLTGARERWLMPRGVKKNTAQHWSTNSSKKTKQHRVQRSGKNDTVDGRPKAG